MKWNLDKLYTSFDSPKLKEDIKILENKIIFINDWAEKNLKDTKDPVNKIETYINLISELEHLSSRISSYARLTLSAEAKNEYAQKLLENVQLKLSDLAKPETLFQKWVGTLENLNDHIDSSNLLKEHSFYLNNLAQKSKYILSDAEEVLIAKMKNTGSTAWNKLQNKLTSTLLVDINLKGEKKQLPLPVVRNLAHDKDPEVRKIAYEAELKAYEKIAESSAACLNGIKGEVITLCKAKGYKSPLENTLINSRMDKETLDAMLSAMKQSLPAFREYFKKKAELLGHKNGLPFYDLFAPIGEVNMNFTYEEAREFIVKNFSTFSTKLGNFADYAFENHWIDAEAREGKRGGAFCSNLHVIKESRILSNFTGSFNDVTTLAHELGHGYHGHCLSEELALNSHYPMPIAETASIFCETIVGNAALKSASKEEAFAILEKEISGNALVIVDILSRYIFETELFVRREEGSLSVNELKEIMINAQREAYGDGLDHNYLHPYMWLNKPHYYYAERNFYNFPYAFGLLFSKGLYAEYLKRGEEFVKEYDNLLAATGKNTVVDIAKMMNIDIHSIDFWKSSLNVIEKQIEDFINL